MTSIIPRELIRHLEWSPGQEEPQKPSPKPIQQTKPQNISSIDTLVREGKPFYSAERDGSGKFIGAARSLEQALGYATNEGIVASMPYLIAGKSKAAKENYLWKNWFTALSEENAGIDKKGILGKKGQELVITVHDGGLLNKERIMQAYNEGLTPQNAAKYKQKEFNDLLKGVLPNGENIELYTIDDIKRRIPEPFGRYAVWMPAEVAKSKSSGYHSKTDFMDNELVIARAGTLEYLDAYFEEAKKSDGTVGNWHRLGEIDFSQPQGRVLFLGGSCGGLGGDYNLSSDGRFFGVSPRSGD
jgi:hypothetical protein